MDEESLGHSVMQRITDGVAATSVVAPLWLTDAHDVFVLWVMPMLGATWLCMQIYYKVKNGK